MPLRNRWLLVLLVFLILLPCRGWGEKGRIEVKDGDSFTIHTSNGEKGVRLYGIDAPEWDQDFHQEAKDFATRFLSGGELRIEPMDTDQFGRTVGLVSVNGRSLNEQMLQAGLAWVFPHYCKKPFCREWYRLQEEARGARRGLWAGENPVPPWEYRHEGKSEASRHKIVGRPHVSGLGAYHGNTSSRVFHKRDCEQYDCKQCTATFWTRSAALRNGYRPCKSCNP